MSKMARHAHFDDLRRRYREADWVSEYQRLWAMFNHWYTAHYQKLQDRKCIENLKGDAQVGKWVHDLIASSEYRGPHRVTDGLQGIYPRFAANNEISLFFRYLEQSPTIRKRTNRPWRPGCDPKVRKINAITLDGDQFVLAYRKHAQVLEECIADFHLTLHQTLPTLSVHATGACFYRGDEDKAVPVETVHHKSRLVQLFRTEPSLSELVDLIDSTEPTDIVSDVIESLYSVRNAAMHGSLDFLDENDNRAARSSYDLLDSLIRFIRDKWTPV